MVASFNTVIDTGGVDGTPGANTSIDALGPPNLRYKLADNATIDNANPLVIPPGANHSYWKSIYLKCTGAPAVQVDNVRIYADGTNPGVGVTLYVGDQMPIKNSGSSAGYKVAVGAGDSGTEMVTGYTGITSKTSLYTYNSGATKSVTISEAGSKITGPNQTTNYIVLQVEVANTAGPGVLTTKNYTWVYDEI